jgi:hypothetical protein
MKTSQMQFQLCPPFAGAGFYELFIQLGINILILLIISRVIYYRWNRNPDYMFAQIIGGLIVFIICALLRWVKLELGLALGLFAIFAIIRFRTINVPVKDMAYLFLVVGLSAMNALLPASECLQWLIFCNSLLILVTLLMETAFFRHSLSCRTITFSNTDLLKPNMHDQLIKELNEMTGLDILRLEISKVDYVRKNARIKIYFRGDRCESSNQGNDASNGDDD